MLVKKRARTKRPQHPKISREDDGAWEWFERGHPSEDETAGKYLFFSANRDTVVNIAMKELSSGEFLLAKIRSEGEFASNDYVLCLYHADKSLTSELAERYEEVRGLSFQGWKSNEATLEPEYSPRLFRELFPGMRVELPGIKRGRRR